VGAKFALSRKERSFRPSRARIIGNDDGPTAIDRRQELEVELSSHDGRFAPPAASFATFLSRNNYSVQFAPSSLDSLGHENPHLLPKHPRTPRSERAGSNRILHRRYSQKGKSFSGLGFAGAWEMFILSDMLPKFSWRMYSGRTASDQKYVASPNQW
jgi:hypothetical protein